MIRFEPTKDYALVRSVLTSLEIWPAIADDFSGDPERFQPIDSLATIGYVAVWDGSNLCGIFTFAYQNAVCWEIHCSLLRHAHGRKARKIAEHLARWIWHATRCRRLVATINRSNYTAIQFAKWAGFEVIGVNEKSVLRHGRLEDRVILGISRPW